eukprot:1193859-Pyramimonas_sp.AAC.1
MRGYLIAPLANIPTRQEALNGGVAVYHEPHRAPRTPERPETRPRSHTGPTWAAKRDRPQRQTGTPYVSRDFI